MRRAAALLPFAAALALLAGGCAASPEVTLPASVRSAEPWEQAAGPRPVLVDTDLDGDDIVALAVLLRDPALDVRAVTVAGTGLVHCAPGVDTARRLLAAFGQPEVPVACGRETPGAGGRAFPDAWRERADARLGLELPPVAAPDAERTATDLITTAINDAGGDLLIVPIGPWTNLADAFAADPALVPLVAGIHAMLGAIDAPGNVQAGVTSFEDRVEWNAGADPAAVAAVLALDIPVVIVPLDATDDVPVPPDMPARLDPDHVAAGADLAYELYLRNPAIAEEEQHLWDSLAALLLSNPELATWEDVTVAVSTGGATAGALSRAEGGRPIRFASSARADAAVEVLLAALRRGTPRPQPFTPAGEVGVRWDGTRCELVSAAPDAVGDHLVRLDNRTAVPAYVGIGGVAAPHTWAEVATFIAGVTPDTAETPTWFTELGSAMAAGSSAVGLARIPAGVSGALCIAGTWPDVSFVAGPGWTVAP